MGLGRSEDWEVSAMFGPFAVLGLLQSSCVHACLAHSFPKNIHSPRCTCVLSHGVFEVIHAVLVLGVGFVGCTPPVSLRALRLLSELKPMPSCGTVAA
jgi:hypothetical protein